jgi:hypothetical protein
MQIMAPIADRVTFTVIVSNRGLFELRAHAEEVP